MGTEVRNRVHGDVDRLFPGFLDEKKTGAVGFTAASLYLMEDRFSAKQIRRRRRPTLVDILKRYGTTEAEATAEKLQQYAGQVLDTPEEHINTLQLSLSQHVKHLRCLQHLRAWCDNSRERVDCYFWRTRGGAEVDFILYGEGQFSAIEVKNAKQVHPKSLRSLKTFIGDFPEASPLLLYRGEERMTVDGIPCWPINAFLLELKPGHWPLSFLLETA